MTNPRIVAVEWARLEGRRPRHAGSNARLGAHGITVRVPILRITAEDGSSGFGVYHGSPERLDELLGVDVRRSVFGHRRGAGALAAVRVCDLGSRRRAREYAGLCAGGTSSPAERWKNRFARRATIPRCTSTICISNPEQAAAELIAAEARAGYERGHRAFKIKVGRGARHMPLEEGTRRDIAIVRAVRAAVGPAAPIMLDANNGYNLNLTKRVLAETADCGILWMEEAFHEDEVLYRDLREWLAQEHLHDPDRRWRGPGRPAADRVGARRDKPRRPCRR